MLFAKMLCILHNYLIKCVNKMFPAVYLCTFFVRDIFIFFYLIWYFFTLLITVLYILHYQVIKVNSIFKITLIKKIPFISLFPNKRDKNYKYSHLINIIITWNSICKITAIKPFILVKPAYYYPSRHIY